MLAAHVRMSGVDDAGDAFAFGFGDFGGHQIDVMHDVAGPLGAPPATARWGRRQTIRGASGGCGGRKFRIEIRSQLHVLMEKRGAARQFLGRVVFEEGPDDRAFWKCRAFCKDTARDRDRCRAGSQNFHCLPAGQPLCKKL